MVLVAVQLSVLGLYLPAGVEAMVPAVRRPRRSFRCRSRLLLGPVRAAGALVVLVAVQLSVLGLYLPPVFKYCRCHYHPPQTIISLPVQTAVCSFRAAGALVSVRWSPRVIGAATRGTSYYRKRVGRFTCRLNDCVQSPLPLRYVQLGAFAETQSAQFACLAPTNRRSNALLILVWPNTPR